MKVQPPGYQGPVGARLTWSQLPPQDESRDICRLKNEQSWKDRMQLLKFDF
jgi:hypothetical protein